MAERVEDLKIWQRSMQFWRAVNAILDRPGLLSDQRLRSQVSDATDSIVSNIVEGFAQSSDRGFARYLFTSKASAAEASSNTFTRAIAAIGAWACITADSLGDKFPTDN